MLYTGFPSKICPLFKYLLIKKYFFFVLRILKLFYFVLIIYSQAKCVQTFALKNIGIDNKDITKQFVSRETVYNVWKHYNNTGTTSSKQIPGRPQNIRTGKFVKDIQKEVKQNP